MATKRHSAEQIVRKLREAEVELARGASVKDACRKLAITEHTYYRRTVPLRSEVVNALRKWRRKSRGEFVFARRSGAPFSKIRRGFQSAVTRAKLGSLRFHDLRHTAASWMAQEGADVHEMARVLGHRDIASTMRYSHLIPRSSRRAVERMPSLEGTSVLDFPGEKSA